MTNTVFISSTFSDLVTHRLAVDRALRNAGYFPIGMENFMARSEGAVSACLKEVADADVFIGIYAWRYGYIPDDSDTSITEIEFDKAYQLAKPIFCFVIDNNYEWPKEDCESGYKAQLLVRLKERIDKILVRAIFTTPDDLASKVLASLHRWEREGDKSNLDQTLKDAEENLKNYNYDDVLVLCKKVFAKERRHPKANLLAAIALLEGGGADKLRSNVVNRVENHLRISTENPAIEATALVILGIVKYDYYIANGLFEGEPSFQNIQARMKVLENNSVDIELLNLLRCSRGVKGRLGLD